MAAAPSQTRIANRALTLLGTARRIHQINDGSALAGTIAALWDDARDVAMADHPWNFAIARTAAAATATPPAFGYARAFELPGDWLRWLPPAKGDDDWFDGEQEGRLILSDAEAPLYLRGIRRIEDLSLWSIGFIDALAWQLAMQACEAVTGGLEGVAKRMAEGYAAALERAKRQDGLATGARGQRLEFTSDWLAARDGYGSSYGGGYGSYWGRR